MAIQTSDALAAETGTLAVRLTRTGFEHTKQFSDITSEEASEIAALWARDFVDGKPRESLREEQAGKAAYYQAPYYQSPEGLRVELRFPEEGRADPCQFRFSGHNAYGFLLGANEIAEIGKTWQERYGTDALVARRKAILMYGPSTDKPGTKYMAVKEGTRQLLGRNNVTDADLEYYASLINLPLDPERTPAQQIRSVLRSDNSKSKTLLIGRIVKAVAADSHPPAKEKADDWNGRGVRLWSGSTATDRVAAGRAGNGHHRVEGRADR